MYLAGLKYACETLTTITCTSERVSGTTVVQGHVKDPSLSVIHHYNTFLVTCQVRVYKCTAQPGGMAGIGSMRRATQAMRLTATANEASLGSGFRSGFA